MILVVATKHYLIFTHKFILKKNFQDDNWMLLTCNIIRYLILNNSIQFTCHQDWKSVVTFVIKLKTNAKLIY